MTSSKISETAAAAREAYRDPSTGRFGSQPAAEASVDLDDPSRRSAISTHDAYVEPASVRVDGTGRGERDQFRRAAALAGEYRHAEGDYPKMNPSVRRGTYGDLTMPNRTAVLRTGKELGATFDLPVRHEGQVSWMRATPGKDGRWEVTPTADHSPASVRTAEAVCAVLEARRPTTVLDGHDAASLLARRRDRLEARGARQDPIASSWIESTGYQSEGRMMVMRTKDTETKAGEHRPGRVYGFRGVPTEHYRALSGAERPGAVFNELIKGRHERVSVEQCGSCGAYHSVGSDVPHVCSSDAQATPRPGASMSGRDVGAAMQRLRS